jgi:hypothetical protein
VSDSAVGIDASNRGRPTPAMPSLGAVVSPFACTTATDSPEAAFAGAAFTTRNDVAVSTVAQVRRDCREGEQSAAGSSGAMASARPGSLPTDVGGDGTSSGGRDIAAAGGDGGCGGRYPC